jgi:hypothetical protein
MTDASESTVFETTKHPVVVLAVATLLGSVLVPYVNARIAQQNSHRELRMSHALQVLRSSSETDRRINLLLTEFANFIQDESISDPAARTALRERVYRLYGEFNRDAWWWYWPLLQEVRVLGLVDESAAIVMSAAIEKYAVYLQESTQALDPLWRHLVSNRAQSGSNQVSSILASTSSRLKDLQQKRQEAIGQMVAPLIR